MPCLRPPGENLQSGIRLKEKQFVSRPPLQGTGIRHSEQAQGCRIAVADTAIAYHQHSDRTLLDQQLEKNRFRQHRQY